LTFWDTLAGLLERASLFGDKIQLGAYNQAVHAYGLAAGAEAFQITGALKATSCEWCILHVGQIYYRGQFMPYLPRHHRCVHTYRALSGADLEQLLGANGGSSSGGVKASSLWWLLPWLALMVSEAIRKEQEKKINEKQGN